MELKQTVEEIGEALKVKRVFGEPSQVVAVVALLAIRSISKARMKARRAEARRAAKAE